MKKIIKSSIVTAVAICFASAASAQLASESPAPSFAQARKTVAAAAEATVQTASSAVSASPVKITAVQPQAIPSQGTEKAVVSEKKPAQPVSMQGEAMPAVKQD